MPKKKAGTISGKALIEGFGIDEYGLLRMIKRGLRPYDQSYKQIESLLKIGLDDLQNEKIQEVIQNLKFTSKGVQEYIGTYGRPQPKKEPPQLPKPDWDYWKKRDLWTLGEAVCLICDCDPEELESEAHPLHYSPRFSSRFYEDGKSKELRRVYELALKSLEAEVLSETEVLEAKVLRPADRWEHELRQGLQKKFKPSHFIAWAKNKGISVPDEIKTFKEKETPRHIVLPTAKEIKPISSMEASKNYKIFPKQQLSNIEKEKLLPHERIPGDSRPRLNFPSMPPSDAPDPTVPRYRCLQKYERDRLTVDKLENVYYPEHQVLRLWGEQPHHEVIDDKQGLDRLGTETQKETAEKRVKKGLTKTQRKVLELVPKWQEYARNKLELKPDIKIARVIRGILRSGMANDPVGEDYSEKTIRKYIKDLFPNRGPGRPKND